MSNVFSAWRLGRVCGGLADVLKESSEARRGDEQVDGWIGRDIPVGVWRPGSAVVMSTSTAGSAETFGGRVASREGRRCSRQPGRRFYSRPWVP